MLLFGCVFGPVGIPLKIEGNIKGFHTLCTGSASVCKLGEPSEEGDGCRAGKAVADAPEMSLSMLRTSSAV